MDKDEANWASAEDYLQNWRKVNEGKAENVEVVLLKVALRLSIMSAEKKKKEEKYLHFSKKCGFISQAMLS